MSIIVNFTNVQNYNKSIHAMQACILLFDYSGSILWISTSIKHTGNSEAVSIDKTLRDGHHCKRIPLFIVLFSLNLYQCQNPTIYDILNVTRS
jgi:hypothetical protein